MRASRLLCLLALLAGCPRKDPEPLPAPAPATAPATEAVGSPAGTAAAPPSRVPESWPHPLDAEAAVARSGMVATDAALATRVGVDVLKQGGNAVDAAVATAFALAVVFPQAGNVGGGGFAVVHTAGGESAALDFRETAPRKAHRDMFLGPGKRPTDRSRIGHLAAGVPGSVAGLWALHQKYGSLPWEDLVAPAIALARDGFVVDEELAESVAAAAPGFQQFSASAKLFLPGGKPLEQGQLWKNPDLARVLERIAKRGASGFYQGETARLIEDDMQRGRGLITRQDLARYQPRWREPVVFTYRGHTVISMPPPSSGGLVLAFLANVLEDDDLGALGWHSPDEIHLLAEAMKRAFARRNQLLGDPDFVQIPWDAFLSKEVAAAERASISMTRATPAAEVSGRLDEARESSETTHFSIVDSAGNAVALTTTINGSYGAKVVVRGAGFLLNNEMDDFAVAPGQPNMFGLVQGEANAIAPQKRMLSSMTPTIVLDADGRVLLVTGAAGGPTIISSVFQILTSVLDHGMDVAEAASAPRLHHQHLPDAILVEPGGFPDATVKALEARGHAVRPSPFPLGDVLTILRTKDGWTSLGEPRQKGALAAGH